MNDTISFSYIITSIFKDNTVIGAISSSLFIILLGFFLSRKGIISEALSKGLTVIVLSVGLPALSFNSFMQDINSESLKHGINILIWGFIFQGALIFITKWYYFAYRGDTKKALSALTTLGSTTFFGIPIIGAIYGASGVLFASIFNISYRIFLYSWGLITFSGLKVNRENLKTMFLNPIILATFLGLFVWLFQSYLPQVNVTKGDTVKSFAFLRIDQTAFWLFKPLSYLAAISSPLAWLAIGATLGRISLKQAFASHTAWFYSFTKAIIVPLICIACLFFINFFMEISFLTVAVSAIMMATPPATVVVTYAIKFDKEALLASNCSLVGTVLSIIIMPFLILILELLNQMHIFS